MAEYIYINNAYTIEIYSNASTIPICVINKAALGSATWRL